MLNNKMAKYFPLYIEMIIKLPICIGCRSASGCSTIRSGKWIKFWERINICRRKSMPRIEMNNSFDQLLPTSIKQWLKKKKGRSQKRRGGKLRRSKRCFSIIKECMKLRWRGKNGNSNKIKEQYRRNWRWNRLSNRNSEKKKKGKRRNSIKKCKWETV